MGWPSALKKNLLFTHTFSCPQNTPLFLVHRLPSPLKKNLLFSHTFTSSLPLLTHFQLSPSFFSSLQVAFSIKKNFHFPLISSSTTHSFFNTHPLFLVPQVPFTIKIIIINILTHYQLAFPFSVSSIQTPILARIGHMIFIEHSYLTTTHSVFNTLTDFF